MVNTSISNPNEHPRSSYQRLSRLFAHSCHKEKIPARLQTRAKCQLLKKSHRFGTKVKDNAKNAPDFNLAYNYKMLVERADNRFEELGKRVNDSAAHVDDQPQFREERTWKVARQVGSG